VRDPDRGALHPTDTSSASLPSQPSARPRATKHMIAPTCPRDNRCPDRDI